MTTNRLLLLLVVVVGLLLAHGLGDEDLTASLFLSSKTPYWPQQIGGREPMDERCKLVHVNHLGAFPLSPEIPSVCPRRARRRWRPSRPSAPVHESGSETVRTGPRCHAQYRSSVAYTNFREFPRLPAPH